MEFLPYKFLGKPGLERIAVKQTTCPGSSILKEDSQLGVTQLQTQRLDELAGLLKVDVTFPRTN